jgi:nitroreductase
MSAGTAPSGANLQPWHFAVVSSPAMKRRIREAAEKEEHEFYHRRAPQAWLNALEPLGTDAKKPYLETAPYLIVVFQRNYDIDAAGARIKQYYAGESVGIATGILLTALHHAGLATLTHTPNPMGFLRGLLGRPANERAVMIVVVGYPAKGAKVPDIGRKALADIASFFE